MFQKEEVEETEVAGIKNMGAVEVIATLLQVGVRGGVFHNVGGFLVGGFLQVPFLMTGPFLMTVLLLNEH